MIPKSGNRFSEKMMLKQRAKQAFMASFVARIEQSEIRERFCGGRSPRGVAALHPGYDALPINA
jgi:hypothetical protein